MRFHRPDRRRPKPSSKNRHRGRQTNDKGNTRRTAPGPLTDGENHRTANLAAVAKLTIEERRHEVFHLYVYQRMTMQQIATHLGVSNYTIANDLHEIHYQMRLDRVEETKTWRDMEIARSLQADRQLIPVLYGQVPGVTSAYALRALQMKAAKELRQNQEYRARLLGLNAPITIAQTVSDQEVIYQMLTNEELAAKIREKETALGLKPVIDVAPVKSEDVRTAEAEWWPDELREGTGPPPDTTMSLGDEPI